MTQPALVLAVIGLLSLACQWLSWRLRQPAILLLLLSGIVIGPWLDWLKPDALFGDLLFPVVSLAVAIILFEGALTLKLSEIREHGRVVRRLVTSGMLVNGAVISAGTVLLLDFSWPMAALLGAVTVVTGPTVIVPMLRSVRPTAAVSRILRWEGILIDPIGALLAVLVFEYVVALQTGASHWHSLWVFGETLCLGLILGAMGGQLLGWVLKHHWLPHYLHNLGVLTSVLALFALSNAVLHESGLLTVTVMGMWLANMRGVDLEDILEFKETLSVLLISGLFILLAARLDLTAMMSLGGAALALLALVLWIARPLNVMISTLGSDLSWRERLLLAWIGPRGIVAAAVSALFALKLEALDVPQAEMLVPLVFLVIIGSVLLQSLTSRTLAAWLQVQAPPPSGFLFMGANPLARALGQILQAHKVRVVLADPNWDLVQEARMAGLEVYYGNPLSEHAAQHLDLTGIGHLLAISPYRQLNSLVGYHFRDMFDTRQVFMVNEGSNNARQDSEQVHARLTRLFDGQITYAQLASMMAQGGEVKETKLTENFSFDDYLDHHQRCVLPLLAIDPKGRIQVFSERSQWDVGPGWRLVALLPSAESHFTFSGCVNGERTASS